MRGLVPLLAAFAAVLVSVVYCVLPPTLLPLERAFPLTRRVELDRLRARDRARHARFLRGAVSGVVDFSVQGSSDPYFVGLYFTKVKLGSPPREFNVQIDTGSDILWVTCNSCSDCPQSSGLGLNFFDAASSSTAAVVPCSDPMCTSALQTAATQCSPQSNQCSYSFQYGDGSGTSGYYVSDALYFDMVLGQSLIANSSAPIVFGCSTYQSGDLTKTDKAVDGIFGFGQGDLSVISQLSSRAITPKVFSHCLKGGGNGGGILVLGEILEPGIVYSPLVPSQPHYNLYLQSIAVNGQLLPIDPAAFATSNNRGTIVDSGTTLAYLVDEAYDPFVSSITAIVQQSVTPTISNGNQCYPDERRNGTPKTFMKGVKCLEEQVSPLSFVSQGECIAMQNRIHKPESWRHLGPATGIVVFVSKLSLTHVSNDFCNGEHWRFLLKLFFFWRVLIIAL